MWWFILLVVIIVILWWWINRQTHKTDRGSKFEEETPARVARAIEKPISAPEPSIAEEEIVAGASVEMVEPEVSVWEPEVEAEIPVSEAEINAEELAVPAEEPKPIIPDNLKRIEGIGPKIAGVLQEAGIQTFAQLAETEISRLQEILDDAGIRLAYPETWPEQAALAAAGDWDALAALQDQLKGGRRV